MPECVVPRAVKAAQLREQVGVRQVGGSHGWSAMMPVSRIRRE